MGDSSYYAYTVKSATGMEQTERESGVGTNTTLAGHDAGGTAWGGSFAGAGITALSGVAAGILDEVCPRQFQAGIDVVGRQLGNRAFLHWVAALQQDFGRHDIKEMGEYTGCETGLAPAAGGPLQLMPRKRKKKGEATKEETSESGATALPEPGTEVVAEPGVRLAEADPEVSAVAGEKKKKKKKKKSTDPGMRQAAGSGLGQDREEPVRARLKTELTAKEQVLFDCCIRGDNRSVRRLLKFGTRTLDVNMASDNGTLLCIAACMGYAAIVMELLSRPGIDVNLAQETGATPLFFAAQQGHVAVVKLLMDTRGINVNLVTEQYNTPLCIAAILGREEVVRLLLEAPDIKINARKDDGASALFSAAQDNFPGIVALLIKRGADVDLPLDDGTLPLSIAAKHGNVEVVRLLLQVADIQVDQPTGGGVTALCVSSQFGHKEVVSMLLEKKADPNIANIMGVAPLHVACLKGHTAIVEMLLHAGANLEAAVAAPAAEKYAAYALARLAGHQEIISLLETYRQARPVPTPRVDTLSLEDKPSPPLPSTILPETLPLATATMPSEPEEVPTTPSAQAESQATGTIEPGEMSPPGALSEISSQAFPDSQPQVTKKQSPLDVAKQELIQGILRKLNNDDLDSLEGIRIMVQVRAAENIDELCGLYNQLASIERHKRRSRYRRVQRRGFAAGPEAVPPDAADLMFALGQNRNLDAEAVEIEIKRHLEQSCHRFVGQVVNDMEFGRGKPTSGYPGLLHASAGITGVGSCSVFFYINQDMQVIRIVGIGHHIGRATYRLNYADEGLGGSGRTLRID